MMIVRRCVDFRMLPRRWACRMAVVAVCFLLQHGVSLAASEVIGTKPPEWKVTDWIGSPPLTKTGLRGQVVLIRWWTAPDCPFCAASADALNGWDSRYREKGLTVIGFYHHKSSTPLKVADVAAHRRRLRFEFPVAIDRDWRTLQTWWLDRGESDWTSVTFLLDRKGAVRFVHPGGQYVKGDKAYSELEAKIRELLGEQ